MSIERIKTDGPGSESWKALRKNYIGGSDCAAIIGLNPFSSPYALWAEKTGRTPEFSGNLATRVGSYLEAFVAELWAEENGKKVHRENLSYVNSEYPWAIADIDRKVDGEDAGLEIKTTSELRTRLFRNGEFPENYYCQCMHYMAVTGYQRWYLAVLIGNREFKTYVIERDEEEIGSLMEAEKAFWNTYVLPRKAPPADGSDATSRAISQLYPSGIDTSVNLDPLSGLLTERKSLMDSMKVMEARKSEIENTIKTGMGAAEHADCGTWNISWKEQSRTTFDWKKYQAEHPTAVLKPYLNESGSRVLRITERKA